MSLFARLALLFGLSVVAFGNARPEWFLPTDRACCGDTCDCSHASPSCCGDEGGSAPAVTNDCDCGQAPDPLLVSGFVAVSIAEEQDAHESNGSYRRVGRSSGKPSSRDEQPESEPPRA